MNEMDDLFSALDNLPIEDTTVIAAHLPPKKPLSKKKSDAPEPVIVEEATAVQEHKTWGSDRITWESVKEIAEEVFGEEFVDVLPSSGSGYVMIRFPELTITNSYDNSHVIRELYVKVQMKITSAGALASLTISGARGALSVKENASHYAHSHLPSEAALGQFTTFCLGTSGFRVIFTNLTGNPSEELFFLFMLSIRPYVEWESLEGGPYRKIAELRSDSSRNRPNYDNLLRGFIKYIPESALDFDGALILNPYAPAMEVFYDDYSPIRQLSATGNTGGAADAQTLWRRNNRLEILFKGEQKQMVILEEEIITPEQPNVERTIVDGYNVVIDSKLNQFNQSFDNEYRNKFHTKALGARPTFEQADINNYRATARPHRLPSRKSRAKRVVGRVNNIRKREDNRFR